MEIFSRYNILLFVFYNRYLPVTIPFSMMLGSYLSWHDYLKLGTRAKLTFRKKV